MVQSSSPETGFLCLTVTMSIPNPLPTLGQRRGSGHTVPSSQSSPVAVVGGQRVGDVPPGHQEESAPDVPDTADRDEDEGGLDGDAPFIKELQRKGDRSAQQSGSHQHYSRRPRGGHKPTSLHGCMGKRLWCPHTAEQ